MKHRSRKSAFRAEFAQLEDRVLLSGASSDLGIAPVGSLAPQVASAQQVLVRFLNDTPTKSQTLISTRGELGGLDAALGQTRVLTLRPGFSAEQTAALLNRYPDVLYAEPNRELTATAITVNDANYAQQWGLSNSNNMDIDAPEGWAAATPASTIVAVIDSGIDRQHPDLQSQIWTNTDEIAGNGVDDDRNGYIDDTQGWNYVTNTGNVQDDYGHGTHVSGIIAAAANNGVGIVGVNPNAKIMPLKFLSASGGGSIEDAARAIRYAVDNGARVINASWTGGGYSRTLDDAIRYAASKNVVFVAAAGNEARSNDRTVSYPSGYSGDNVLAVTATDSAGKLAAYANFGVGNVDIAAPGSNIYSTWLSGGYKTMSGTSMATPFVTAAVSILVGQPATAGLTAAQLVQRIIATAKPDASLNNVIKSAGILDLDNAVSGVTQPKASTPARPTATRPTRPVVVRPVRARAVAAAAAQQFHMGNAFRFGHKSS